MGRETDKMTQDQADHTAARLDELWERIDAEDRDGSDDYDAHVELDESPLEIVWEKGEPFAVVLGIGGPHIEITGGGRASGSGYTLNVYWGGSVAHARSEGVTRTGAYFRELCEDTYGE